MKDLAVQFFFYPFLAVLGLTSLLLGFVHIFLCLPFYFVFVGVINGVLLLVITFHGCFLKAPTRGHCALQTFGALWAIVVAILCSLELFCIVPEQEQQLRITERGSVCYGLSYRTRALRDVCLAGVGPLRTILYDKLFGGIGEQNVDRIVTGGQVGVGLIQLLCCGAMAWYCSIATHIRPRAYHAQIPLAVIIAILGYGCIHTVFCCMYFYVGFAIWSSAIILIQAIITLKTEGNGSLSRAVNLIGAGFGMSLTAINMFGLFCWFEGITKSTDWAFRWHCVYRQETYQHCVRRIIYSYPYSAWPAEDLILAEIQNFQFVSYAGIIICGLCQLVISIHSMFRKTARSV